MYWGPFYISPETETIILLVVFSPIFLLVIGIDLVPMITYAIERFLVR